jgi:predicted O-methyltransferase YrrM
MHNLFDPTDPVLRLPVPCTQEKTELENLILRVQRIEPRRILEIGGFLGGTVYAWIAHTQAREVHVIEDFEGLRSIPENAYPIKGFEHVPQWPLFPHEVKDQWRIWAFDNTKNVIPHEANSHEYFDSLKECFPDEEHPFDFLFIDGDHSYEGAKEDFYLYSKLVRPGGIVALHDIINYAEVPENNVQPLWEEIKADFNYKTVELVSRPNQNWMGIGVVYIQ